MPFFFAGLLAVAWLAGAAPPAFAACTWEWECDPGGSCIQVPICTSTLDIVPPAPPGIAPIAPPSIKPIMPPTLPPLGTSECREAYLCGALGDCDWRVVCE